MKKILILMLAILIVSCSESSDSDENSLNNSASIVGTWKYVKDVTVLCDGSEEVFYEPHCGEKYSTLEFTSNGNLIEVLNKDENCDIDQINNGTYWITDGTSEGIPEDILWLNFPPPDDNLGYRLYELSSNTLRWGNKITETEDPNLPLCPTGANVDYYYYELFRVE